MKTRKKSKLEEFIDTYGLKTVVDGLRKAAEHKKLEAKENGEHTKMKAWEADETTLRNMLPLIIDEKSLADQRINIENLG